MKTLDYLKTLPLATRNDKAWGKDRFDGLAALLRFSSEEDEETLKRIVPTKTRIVYAYKNNTVDTFCHD